MCSVVGIVPRAVGDLFASRALLGLDLRMSVVSILGDSLTDMITDGALSRAGVAVEGVDSTMLDKTLVRNLILDDEMSALDLLRSVLYSAERRDGGKNSHRKGHVVVIITVTRPEVR